MKQGTKNWLSLALLACVWGSSFILMKRGMFASNGEPVFDFFQVGALRMFFAGLVLLPYAIRAIKKVPSWKIWLTLLASGLCGNFIPAFLFTYAERGVSSGYAGMLNSFTPIFTLLIGFIVFANRLSRIQVFGVLIGTIGIVTLSLSGELQPNTGTHWHVLAIVLATFLYGISLNLIKFRLQVLKPLEITSLAFFTVLGPATFSVLYFDAKEVLLTNPNAWSSIGFIAILGIVGTALAVILFNQVIAKTSTLFATSVTYLIPIVAVFLGLIDHERITLSQVFGMLIILSGVFIANYLPQLLARKKIGEDNDEQKLVISK